jgi:hypothetical protein
LVPTKRIVPPPATRSDEAVGGLHPTERLLEVDDVDAVALTEDERFIFGFHRRVW